MEILIGIIVILLLVIFMLIRSLNTMEGDLYDLNIVHAKIVAQHENAMARMASLKTRVEKEQEHRAEHDERIEKLTNQMNELENNGPIREYWSN